MCTPLWLCNKSHKMHSIGLALSKGSKMRAALIMVPPLPTLVLQKWPGWVCAGKPRGGARVKDSGRGRNVLLVGKVVKSIKMCLITACLPISFGEMEGANYQKKYGWVNREEIPGVILSFKLPVCKITTITNICWTITICQAGCCVMCIISFNP